MRRSTSLALGPVAMLFLIMLSGQVVGQPYGHQFSIQDGSSGLAIGAKFGWSLAVANDRVAIGSPHYNDQYGRVAYHALDGQGATELLSYCRDNLVNGSGTNPIQQRFGASVAADGAWVVVGNCSPFGTTQYCNDQADRVLVYQYVGDTLQGYQSITSPATGGSFGKAIAIEGDLVVIGGALSYVNGGWRDVVYLYQRSGELWPTQPTDSLVVSEALGTESFGHALALKNGVLLVGASADSELADSCGAAYLFGREQNGIEGWELIRKLLPSNGLAGDQFGTAVALTGERCVVGAPNRSVEGVRAGAAYVFDRDQGFFGNWGEVVYLEPIGDLAAFMSFGDAVALGPDRVAIGAPKHQLNGSGFDGSVHVYGKDGEVWNAIQRIAPQQEGLVSVASRSGTSLTFLGDQLLIGSPWARLLGQTPMAGITGAVLVYSEGPVFLSSHDRSDLRLYPNPCTERVHIRAETDNLVRIRMVDSVGREVWPWEIATGNMFSWNVADMEPGSYIVQCELASGKRVTLPLVRQ